MHNIKYILLVANFMSLRFEGEILHVSPPGFVQVLSQNIYMLSFWLIISDHVIYHVTCRADFETIHAEGFLFIGRYE